MVPASKREFAVTIDQQLRAAWRHERRFVHVRGLCRCVIWLVLVVFLGLLIDWGVLYKTRMPAVVSLLLGGIGLGTMTWVIYREWIRHLRPFDATRVALDVEAKHPELMSALSSYTQMDSMAKDSQASPELLEAMRDFAMETARTLSFTDIIDFSQIKRLTTYACAVLLIAGAMSVQWSAYLEAMVRRITGQGADYPIRTQLLEISGDLIVAKGNPVDLEVRAGGVIPATAVLHVRPKGESGGWIEMPMEALANGFTFRRQLDAPDRDRDYYITMGDYRSEIFGITVIAAPRVAQAQVHVEFPDYLNRSPLTSDLLNQEVPEDSRIRWQLQTDKPVAKLGVIVGDTRLDAEIAADRTEMTFALPAERNFTYTFEWTEGSSGKAFIFEDVQYSIKTIKDTLPRIAFEGRPPQGIATVNKTAKIAWQAKDDYGLGAVFLAYSVATDGQSETPAAEHTQIADPQGRISAGDSFNWNLADAIPALGTGVRIKYHLETADLKPKRPDDQRLARTPVKELAIVSKDDYIAWFRRELATRNDAVTAVFKNQLEALETIKQLPEQKDQEVAGHLQTLESRQSADARKLDKVADELAWLLAELESNGLFEQARGDTVELFKTTVADVSADNLPAAAQHLRNARLETDAFEQHLANADREVQSIIERLSKILAGSSTLLVQEELVTELKAIIEGQTELRARTAEWGKALLISPDTAGAGKGPLMQDQGGLVGRLQGFIEKLETERDETLDEGAKSRFKQAALALTPAGTSSELLKTVLVSEPGVTKVLQAAIDQIDNADVLYAVDAQDRGLSMLKAALQILAAGQSDLADFVAGLEKLLKKQRDLRKEVAAAETLETKGALFEARQVEIMDETMTYTFDAPDLFVSKEGEYLVEPLLTALGEAVAALTAKDKDSTLPAQDRVIALLESAYGAAEEAKEKEEGDPFWAYSPFVPEDKWKLPEDGDEEDQLLKDEDFPEIFEGITSAELMIQPDSVGKGAQADVSTAMAANRYISLESEDDSEPPDFITDEGPPSAGDKEAPDEAGEDTVGNTTELADKGRLADDAIQRRRQRAKIQEYVRDLPPEFRRQVADYYEVIAE